MRIEEKPETSHPTRRVMRQFIYAFASIQLLYPNLSNADLFVHATEYAKIRSAIVSQGCLGSIFDNIRVGINGVSSTTSKPTSARITFRFEGEINTRCPTDDHDDILLTVGEARIGVVWKYGELQFGKQWSPYNNFLGAIATEFNISSAMSLFKGINCATHRNSKKFCTDRYSHLNYALSFSSPVFQKMYETPDIFKTTISDRNTSATNIDNATTKLNEIKSLQSDLFSFGGFEFQAAMTPDVISIGLGYYRPSTKIEDIIQFDGLAFGMIHGLNQDEELQSIGLSYGGRSANGLDYNLTIEEFHAQRDSDSYRGNTVRLSGELHDLSRRFGSRLNPTYLAVNSSFSFGCAEKHEKFAAVTSTRNIISDCIIGLKYRHMPNMSVSVEWLNRNESRSSMKNILGLYMSISL